MSLSCPLRMAGKRMLPETSKMIWRAGALCGMVLLLESGGGNGADNLHAVIDVIALITRMAFHGPGDAWVEGFKNHRDLLFLGELGHSFEAFEAVFGALFE